MEILLLSVLFILIVPSFIFLKKSTDTLGFYFGRMEKNSEPSTLAITFSLVTSWIFSRSLLTAAILGYYYSFPGIVAYSIYYFSFLTGAYFILKIRKEYSVKSVVSFFYNEFGNTGKYLYSFLISLRLLSEIFANLLVVGLIFGEEGSIINNFNYEYSIFIFILWRF